MAKATAKSKPATEAGRWALPARQARSRATREKLLAAAERVFADKGYDGARLSDIAEAAGCSVGAVYFRFKDKDALFFAIAESFTAEARAKMLALLKAGRGGAPKVVIRQFVTGTAADFRAHKGLFRAIVERGFDHPLAMKTIHAVRDELADALETALRGRMTERDGFAFSIRVATQMIYGFLLNGVLNVKAPTRIDDARAIEELANAVVAYLHAEDRA
jgi:AcrR family transcriptional regulator